MAGKDATSQEGKPRGLRKLATGAINRVFGLADAWENALTGLGQLTDKLRYHLPGALRYLSDSQVESLFHSDSAARTIVEELPEAAFAHGFPLTYDGEMDGDDLAKWRKAIEKELARLGARDRLLDAFVWGRKDGRGGLLLGIDDGRPMDQPLDRERISRLIYVEPLEKWQFSMARLGEDPDSAYFGKPEVWRVNRLSNKHVLVHADRIITTGGPRTSRTVWRARGFADMSVLDSAFEALQGFDQVFRTINHMVADASKMVMAIRDFLDSMGSADSSAFTDRLDMIAQASSVANILPIDAEDESVTFLSRNFSGLDGILQRFEMRLAAAARMPVSVLMGRSPAGMNATGESDLSCWYDQVQAFQRNVATARAELLVQLVAYAVGAPEPESWGIEWPSLWQMSDPEKADYQKKVADVDSIYILEGVLKPEQVAIARFGDGEWSARAPQVDVEALQAELEASEEEEEEEEEEEGGETVGKMPLPFLQPAMTPPSEEEEEEEEEEGAEEES